MSGKDVSRNRLHAWATGLRFLLDGKTMEPVFEGHVAMLASDSDSGMESDNEEPSSCGAFDATQEHSFIGTSAEPESQRESARANNVADPLVGRLIHAVLKDLERSDSSELLLENHERVGGSHTGIPKLNQLAARLSNTYVIPNMCTSQKVVVAIISRGYYIHCLCTAVCFLCDLV